MTFAERVKRQTLGAYHRAMADAFLVDGDLVAAQAGYQQALALWPEGAAEPRLALAWIGTPAPGIVIEAGPEASAAAVGVCLALGALLERRGRHAAALALFRLAVVVMPDSWEAWTHQGDTHRLTGALPAARAAYERVLKLAVDQPARAVVRRRDLGPDYAQWADDLAARAEPAATVLAAWEAACALDPERSEHWQGLAAAAHAAGQAALARLATCRAGDRALAAGDRIAAEAAFRQVLAVAPEHPAALAGLAAVLEAENRLTELAAVLRIQLAAGPPPPEPEPEPEPFGHAGDGAAGSPPPATLWLHLSGVLETLGDQDAAEAAARACLRLTPASASSAADLMAQRTPALNRLGRLLAGRGEAVRAEGVWRAALAGDPAAVGPMFRLGQALARQGRRQEAATLLHRAVTLPQARAEMFAAWAAFLAEGGPERRPAVLAAIDEALRRRPGRVETLHQLWPLIQAEGDSGRCALFWQRLGELAASRRQPAVARLALATALSLEPAWPALWIARAEAGEALGDLAAAAADWQGAVACAPDSAPSFHRLARCLEALEQPQAAAAAHARALEGDVW